MRDLRDKLEADYEAHVSSMGWGGASYDKVMGRLIRDMAPTSKVPWETLLNRTLRGMLDKIARQGEPTYRRFSRRTYSLHGSKSAYIAPGKKGSPGVDVAFIVDTSGSVSELGLGIALREVSVVVASPLVGRVLFIAADWTVTAAEEIMAAHTRNPREARRKIAPLMKGGRGTEDMVINALREIPKANGRRRREGLDPIENVVVVTDGLMEWPEPKVVSGLNVIIVLVPSVMGPVPKTAINKAQQDASYAKVIVASI